MHRCWFAEVLGPPAGACDGQLVKVHLVPKQAVRREVLSVRRAAYDAWPTAADQRAELSRILWDERVWVPACGGPTGLGGHHGAYDSGRIAVPPEKLPPGLREYLAELGLEWMIERYFGAAQSALLADS